MTKKEFLRGISFLLVVCLTLFILCDLFEQENGGNTDRTFYTYRNLEADGYASTEVAVHLYTAETGDLCAFLFFRWETKDML